MSDEIDYKAISEKLQRDLEQARLTILEMRYNTHSFGIDGERVKEWVQENYVVIAVAIMLLSFIVSALKAVGALFHKHKGDS
jgi:hypothetical protein